MKTLRLYFNNSTVAVLILNLEILVIVSYISVTTHALRHILWASLSF